MPLNITLRDRVSAFNRAKEMFHPVLKTIFDEPAFILTDRNPRLVRGALVTAVLPLSRFIEMFGDLVEAGDYSIKSYKERNTVGNFGIHESVFERWADEGPLRR